MTHIDLNCDVGEGAAHDADVIPLVSSISVACGGHAGDNATMRVAIDLAMQHGVAIGAHPGLPDREGFGRRERPVTPDDARALVASQTQTLMDLAAVCGAFVTHVKPHGALYNMAARDALLARAVAEGVRECGSHFVLIGLAGSCLVDAASAVGLRSAAEAFADRTYQGDGSLTPRSVPDAVIENEETIAAQAIAIARSGSLDCRDGTRLVLRAETICVHGDGARAVQALRHIRAAFARAGIAVSPLLPDLSR